MKTIFVTGGFGPSQMVLELDTERYACEETEP